MYHLNVTNFDCKDTAPIAWHVLIKLIGLSMVGLFMPVILRVEYGLSLSDILLFEMAFSGILLTIGHSAGFSYTARHGSAASMVLGIVIFIVNYIALYLAKTYPLLIVLSPVCTALYVSYFWVGYHAAMATQSGQGNNIGKKQSFIESIALFAGLIGPVVGGSLADQFGSNILFFIAGGCLFLSLIPFFFHQTDHVATHFSVRSSFSKMRSKPELTKAIFSSFASLGYIDFVGTVIWTLILYAFLGTYTKVALVGLLSGSLLFCIFYRFGKHHTQSNRSNSMLKRSFWSQSGTWVFATLLLVSGFISQFFFLIIDTFHKITYKVTNLSLMTLFYEQIGNETKQGMSVLDSIFLREIAIHSVRIFGCGVIVLLLQLFDRSEKSGLIFAVFSILFVIPLGLVFVRRKERHETIACSQSSVV